MGIASIVHLYVFPAKPYKRMGERFQGSVAVLGDYFSADCPLDPDEVRDSERPTKLRLPQPDHDARSGMTIRESMRDVFVGGGEYIMDNLSMTESQTEDPLSIGCEDVVPDTQSEEDIIPECINKRKGRGKAKNLSFKEKKEKGEHFDVRFPLVFKGVVGKDASTFKGSYERGFFPFSYK